jgi:hypothetical protein
MMDPELKRRLAELIKSCELVQERTLDLMSTMPHVFEPDTVRWENILTSSAEIKAQVSLLAAFIEQVPTDDTHHDQVT